MNRASERRGADRLRDEVGRSGVYPASGPLPEEDAPIRGQMEWGQGERGAAGYKDHGSSELSLQAGAGQVGMGEEWAAIFGNSAMHAVDGREVPVAAWPLFCDWFTHRYAGVVTTIMLADGKPAFPVAARRLALVKIWAHVMEDKVDAVSVELDRQPNDYLLNVTGAKRMTYVTEANGEPKSLSVEQGEGRAVLFFGDAA